MAERNWKAEFVDMVNFNRIYANGRDPIEQAADDIRLVDAARFALTGITTSLAADSQAVENTLVRIEYDYDLTPTEVLVAMGISQDRIVEGRL